MENEYLTTEMPYLAEETIMTEPVHIKNIFETSPMAGMLPHMSGLGGAGAGAMGGFGAGALGGLLASSLTGNGGLLGGRNGSVEGLVTPTLLANEINRVQDNTQFAVAASERLTQSRFDAEAQREIQAAIERTAAATQLAFAVGNSALGVEVAKGQGEVNTQIALTSGATQTQAALLAGNLNTQGALNAAATQTLVQKTSGDLATQLALGDARTQMQIADLGTANALAFKDVAIGQLTTKYDLAKAISDDGEETRELIAANYNQDLNRKLTTAENAIIELRGDREGTRRARETEINVSQNVNQVQAQAQAQSINTQLLTALQTLISQNQNIHNGIVNLGTMTGNLQSAANTRVN